MRRFARLTCVADCIDAFAALSLNLVEVRVISNAGGRVTEDGLRGQALSTHVVGLDMVAVMQQHANRGLVEVTEEQPQSFSGADLGLPAALGAAAR